jgi:hypothetical protein
MNNQINNQINTESNDNQWIDAKATAKSKNAKNLNRLAEKEAIKIEQNKHKIFLENKAKLKAEKAKIKAEKAEKANTYSYEKVKEKYVYNFNTSSYTPTSYYFDTSYNDIGNYQQENQGQGYR